MFYKVCHEPSVRRCDDIDTIFIAEIEHIFTQRESLSNNTVDTCSLHEHYILSEPVQRNGDTALRIEFIVLYKLKRKSLIIDIELIHDDLGRSEAEPSLLNAYNTILGI